mgnify:CR=1 FL=1
MDSFGDPKNIGKSKNINESEKNVIKYILPDYDFNNKNVFEFGPLIKEERLSLMKYITKKGGNYFCMDHCKQYGQSRTQCLALQKKYGFYFEINDYMPLINDPSKINNYPILKNNKFDLYFMKCGVQTGEELKVIKLIMKLNPDAKLILVPFHYIKKITPNYRTREQNIIFHKNQQYEKLGCKVIEVSDEVFQNFHHVKNYNIIITRNI